MHDRIESLYDNLTTHLLGCENAAALLITGMLANGHVLIQGSPGVGKTSLATTMAESLDCEFRRIQFTPDLLPSDIIGYTIYEQSSSSFAFHKGPIFGNIIVADEINRASPRTQSALLEAMNEHQVSVDGSTHRLEAPFFVVATENHLTAAGTFPLPDSQLDRFLLSFRMETPSPEVLKRVLDFHTSRGAFEKSPAVLSKEEIVAIQREVRNIHVSENIQKYIVEICNNTAKHKAVDSGPSPRAAIALMNAGKAYAYISNRSAVHPDDIKKIIANVFRHRLSLRHTRGQDSDHAERIIHEIVEMSSVPIDEA